jgi:hypothetical protein
MAIKGRVGVFFIFISLIILLVFSLTAQAGQPNYLYLFAGVVVLVLGGVIIWRNRPAPPSEDRFRMLRSSKEKRAEKKKKKEEEKQEEWG